MHLQHLTLGWLLECGAHLAARVDTGALFEPAALELSEQDLAEGEKALGELRQAPPWFDRDIDGVSERGEVVPVEALGIVALATEATESIGCSLGNPCGLELADGRILPTYDWFVERRREAVDRTPGVSD